MPIVLGGLAIGVGILLINLMRGGSGGGGSVITRTPPPGAVRPPAPAPAMPGVDEGLVLATSETARIATTPAPRPRPAAAPTPPAERPRSRGIVTSDEPSGATTESLTITPPTRPTPPSGGRSGPSSTRPTETASSRAVESSAMPDAVMSRARRALAVLTSSVPDSERYEAVRAFQAAYGQGLSTDGDYGRNTRRALSLILMIAESELPAIGTGP